MYFELFKLRNWRKRSAEVRRHNCAVLPYYNDYSIWDVGGQAD